MREYLYSIRDGKFAVGPLTMKDLASKVREISLSSSAIVVTHTRLGDQYSSIADFPSLDSRNQLDLIVPDLGGTETAHTSAPHRDIFEIISLISILMLFVIPFVFVLCLFSGWFPNERGASRRFFTGLAFVQLAGIVGGILSLFGLKKGAIAQIAFESFVAIVGGGILFTAELSFAGLVGSGP